MADDFSEKKKKKEQRKIESVAYFAHLIKIFF